MSSKGMSKKERIQSAQMLAKVLPIQDAVEQQGLLVAENLISDHTEAIRRFSKRLQRKREDEEVLRGPGIVPIAERSEAFVQDQIIIAPEIMTLILTELDFRSLKKVRLVCKSWLQAAQSHLERRAIVRFKREDYPARFKSFKETRRIQVLRALPQPFHALDVDLYIWHENLPYKFYLKQFGALCPPLVITRFSPADVPLKLALPLIIKCSSSLEYLKLSAHSCETGFLPPMDPAQNFPQLRHFNTSALAVRQNTEAHIFHFPSIVAWIVNSSPMLETFKLSSEYNKLGSRILQKVDIKNVKRLKIGSIRLTSAAVKQFWSIPFTQLQNLELDISVEEEHAEGQDSDRLIITTLEKCTATLKVLHLDYDFRAPGALACLPVCPNLQELNLFSFGHWNNFLFSRFPSLQVLNIFSYMREVVLGDSWKDLSPFLGVKTLRAESEYDWNSGDGYSEPDTHSDPILPLLFLEKFPALERLRVDSSFARRCWRQELVDNQRFMTILEGVKHLEIDGDIPNWFVAAPSPFASQTTIAIFKGIEAITMMLSIEQLPHIPFQDLPLLKLIQFPWRDCSNLAALVEVASRIERVVVTNCCDVLRNALGRESKDLLKVFFEAAPNAVCGCKGRKTIPNWN